MFNVRNPKWHIQGIDNIPVVCDVKASFIFVAT